AIPPDVWEHPILSRAEAYCIRVLPGSEQQGSRIVIVGSDPRGLLYGAGRLVRAIHFGVAGGVSLESSWSCATAPDRAIRGHQIGYRARANSWDAWTVDQFDQYFRELILFGANCMENIPFQDSNVSEWMKYSRAELNVRFAEACARYDLDHWLWVPVEFSVSDSVQADAFLAQQEALYRDCPRLDAVFVPGGDPGGNPASQLMPYVRRMAERLQRYHPQAQLWVSLQGMKGEDVDAFFGYLERERPQWLGGVVTGPSSPPLDATRARLPAVYRLRWYPDITHIVRCQFPIPWLDPVWGATLGREPVNPRPEDYRAIYLANYRHTDGFLTYSDGVHDDFNKCLWLQMGWDPRQSARDMAREYASCFFAPELADLGADALLGLETNLRGDAANQGSIPGTLRMWRELQERLPARRVDWRFTLHLLRACYDTYTRDRYLVETAYERAALDALARAGQDGPDAAMATARGKLAQADIECNQGLRDEIERLADSLFRSIGLQTSVPKYQASGYERGCILDTLHYPLNNRWWLEDQFDRVAQMSSRPDQLRRLQELADWENPGERGYYEVLGHVGRSPRMPKLLLAGDTLRHTDDLPTPTQRNMGVERRNVRFAWHVYQDTLIPLVYDALDPHGQYTVRLFAQRDSPLVIDGVPARRIRTGDQFDQVLEQEFEVPAQAVLDGRIELSWQPLDQRHLNWRQYHYVTELWLRRRTLSGAE
ncbi:MAG: hypothetical protein AB7F89_23430, partial [Pirellulaceae bacterium]